MNKKSSLFKEISEIEISQIFLHSLGESEIISSNLLEGGLFNTTYYVVYGKEQKQAVLRLGPINRHLIMGFEENLMEAEVYVCNICRELGIPSSKVLSCDTSKLMIDRDFMIVEYIPSIVMWKADLKEEEKDKLYYKMGEYLFKIHQIKGEYFGYLSRTQKGICFTRWSDALFYEVEDILKRLKERSSFTETEVLMINRLYKENGYILDEITIPHLLHTDLWEGNVLLREDTHEIAAIIDGDRAVWGDIDFEFSSSWMQNAILKEGYGLKSDEGFDENRKKRILLYQLFYALLEAYVGAAEYNDYGQYRVNRQKAFEIIKKINIYERGKKIE